MTEQAQAPDPVPEAAGRSQTYRLPVWALPVIGLGTCTAVGWFYGAVGVGIAVAVLATVAIATVGADVWPDRRGRHIAQAVALIVAAAIVALAYLRVDVTRTHLDVRSGDAPLDLRNRQLSVSDVQGKVLRGAQLQGATLSGLDLSGADLSGANLSGAYLTATDLAGAHLNGANLRGADLREACLRGSVLDGADLADVNASGADVSGAAVSQAAIAAARSWPAISTGIGAACT
ncbi:MAG: pentapeptide repeat-containing protein [Pseudonocardiaceae bacterium]